MDEPVSEFTPAMNPRCPASSPGSDASSLSSHYYLETGTIDSESLPLRGEAGAP